MLVDVGAAPAAAFEVEDGADVVGTADFGAAVEEDEVEGAGASDFGATFAETPATAGANAALVAAAGPEVGFEEEGGGRGAFTRAPT